MLELLDSFFRFGGIASSLFMAGLIYRGGRSTLSGKLGILCCLSVSLYLFVYTPNLYTALGMPMLFIATLCMAGPVIIWLFCLSMFDDAFEITKAHYGAAIVFVGAEILLQVIVLNTTGTLLLTTPATAYIVTNTAGPLAVFVGLLVQGMKLGIAGHLCYAAWAGRYDDLVEERRKFRSVFVMFIGVTFAWTVALESYMLGHGGVQTATLFLLTQSASVLFIEGYILWHTTNLRGEWLFGAQETGQTKPLRRSILEDRYDLDILHQMVSQDALLEQGLTITRLAEAAHMPEHRLRRLINQHLGYRNFADYVNYHRIEAAKQRLSSLENRHVPVLTVAMDLGYGSLGPFNRSFKERSGMTPTEYRRKILADC